MPARESLSQGALPIGLAHGVALRQALPAGSLVRWSDVIADESTEALRVRRQMEALFSSDKSGNRSPIAAD
jgi:predicted homoserine dehydrogenase-like protein